ncbi:TRAP transporter small permease [Orrella marina]|uniref:TRAP transporter small permease protein n=1 Tax=Orrella marina TaxID=2163011 RepID=A0A2R4XIH4_9BURK|nr:TRAP transporter small permease [Orrella marina]AWB33588.1 TRAP transporter small permease [Orrella marina]
MNKLEKVLAQIYRVTTIMGGLAIALMMIHITADVVMRFVFNTPIPGTITYVANYYMLIAIFLPLAYAEHTNAHISVEIFSDRLPACIRRHLEGLIFLGSSIVCFIVTDRTWQEAIRRFNSGTAVMQADHSIITWPTYFFLPIGFSLLGLVLLLKFVSYVISLFKKQADLRIHS